MISKTFGVVTYILCNGNLLPIEALLANTSNSISKTFTYIKSNLKNSNTLKHKINIKPKIIIGPIIHPTITLIINAVNETVLKLTAIIGIINKVAEIVIDFIFFLKTKIPIVPAKDNNTLLLFIIKGL